MTEQQATDQPAAGQPAQPAGEGKRAAQGRATRGQLIDVATRLFTEHGYEGTSVEAVLATAGVSRGALYHHFAGKEALFEAVVMAVNQRVTTELRQQIGAVTDPVAALRTAAVAWISLARDPVVQRVVLVDAPSVLGWDRWRALDDGSTLGAMRAMLQMASDAGHLPAGLVEPFAHMILAALDEYALVIARAPDPAVAVEEGRVAVEELLSRLLRP
jgi:AcrR family transcriptional regulator